MSVECKSCASRWQSLLPHCVFPPSVMGSSCNNRVHLLAAPMSRLALLPPVKVQTTQVNPQAAPVNTHL